MTNATRIARLLCVAEELTDARQNLLLHYASGYDVTPNLDATDRELERIRAIAHEVGHNAEWDLTH